MKRPILSIFCFLFSIILLHSLDLAAQSQMAPGVYGALPLTLERLVATPAVSGHEKQLEDEISKELKNFHPVTDNLGNVVVTIGSGAPHRLVVTPIDEPGFVVSEITGDGYLRVQRLPAVGRHAHRPPTLDQDARVAAHLPVRADGHGHSEHRGLENGMQPRAMESPADEGDVRQGVEVGEDPYPVDHHHGRRLRVLEL